MELTERQLKKLIYEETQKAMTGLLNVPEYDVEKSIKRLVALIDSEAEKFNQKYEESGSMVYDAYNTKLYSVSEKLEQFLKQLKEDGPFSLM